MSAHRYRWAAVAWLLTLQFFVVETVVQLRWDAPYSRAHDVISALGAGVSPGHGLMNASFVVQGLLIAAGGALLRPALAGTGGRLAPAFLGAAALGVLLVGLFPLDGQPALHQAGAGLYLVGGGLGLLALAYGVRPRSEALGTTLALLGLVGLAATVFFVAGITDLLGQGGTERAAAYVLPVGLALAGAGLWWLGGRSSAAGAARREQRERERAERAARARERDAALEAAVHRAEQGRPAGAADGGRGRPAPGGVESPQDVDLGDPDPEDPWAGPRRRDRPAG